MVTAPLQQVTTALFQDWVGGHPTLIWGITHPFWALAGLLILLFLMWGLLQAIAQSAANVWVGIGKLPLKFVRGIWWIGLWVLRRSPPPSTPVTPTPEQRLAELFTELEQAQQEQQRLTHEIKLLLQQYPLTSPLKKNLMPSSSPQSRIKYVP